MTLLPNSETHELQFGSTSFVYRDNRADKPAIVLVHGTGGDMERHFGRLIPMLASKYRVIGIDLGTPTEGPALEIEEYVGQLNVVAEHADLRNADVTLVGYSLGAVTTAAFAAQRPEVVNRLVLVSGWAQTEAYQKLRNDIWHRLYASDRETLARFSVFGATSSRYLLARTEQEIEQLVRSAVADESRARQMELNARVNISQELAKIQAETLIITGEEDIMVPPSHGYNLLGGIENARLALLPTGHAVITERPAQVFSLVDQFTRGTLPTPIGEIYAHLPV